jgi:hypothetical protein
MLLVSPAFAGFDAEKIISPSLGPTSYTRINTVGNSCLSAMGRALVEARGASRGVPAAKCDGASIMRPFAKLILMNFLVLVPGGYVFFEWTPLPVSDQVHTLIVLLVGFAMTTVHSVAYRRAVMSPPKSPPTS